MSASKFRFVSPGVFISEIDNSQLARLPAEMGPVIIGRSLRGPAMRPVMVQSFSDFVEVFGIDRVTNITVKFHRRRLTEDKDLYVREGDFVLYGDTFYEIVTIAEPKLLFGQIDYKFEVIAKCVKARENVFNAK